MPKITSKLQLTVPKAIADQYGIRPGDELQWIVAGEAIRVIPAEKNNLAAQARPGELPAKVYWLDLANGQKTFLKQLMPNDPAGVETIGPILHPGCPDVYLRLSPNTI